MGKTRTDLKDALLEEIRAYLEHVQEVLGWSQSEIARRIGAHPSTVNKAFGGKHVLDYPKLMILADQAGAPIPATLTAAAKAAEAGLTEEDGIPDARREAEEFRRRPKGWQEQFLKAINSKS